jgi:nucleotide-binding universal stress UspA family protein
VARRGPGNTVVVGVDGTPAALDATAWAAGEAVLRGQPLRIVHARACADRPVERSRVYRLLDAAVHAARTASPGVDVRVDVETAEPLALLERESEIASLLVLGPPGPGGVTRRVVESAGGLAAGTLAPLVVVPELPSPGRDPAIAVLVDTSSSGVMAMAAAVAAAARRGVRLRAVRVPDPDESPAETEATLEALLARAHSAYPQVGIDTKIATGRPVQVLATVSHDVGLVVVGAREFGPDSALALGSVRQSLLGLARCPVMIVPARLPSAGRRRRRAEAAGWPPVGGSTGTDRIGPGWPDTSVASRRNTSGFGPLVGPQPQPS